MQQARGTTPYISFNPYFLVPFVLWVIGGGIALLFYDKQVLFSAFNTHHTETLDVLMYYTTMLGEGLISTVVLLVLFGLSSFRNWWYFTAAVLCNVVPAVVITQIVKNAVQAPRPLKYFDRAGWIHYNDAWPALMDNSFPSGHTCSAFSFFCFLAFLLTPKYRIGGAVLFFLALMVGYSRMYLAAHFFLDVYVGSIIGVIFVILVIALMRTYAHYFFRKQPL